MSGQTLSGGTLIAAVAIMALVTLATRAFPFLVYRGGRKPSAWVLYLGRVLPPAIIALLVVYCLKETQVWRFPYGIPEAVCCVAALLLQRWRRNAMLSIGVSTALYMVLIQFVFA